MHRCVQSKGPKLTVLLTLPLCCSREGKEESKSSVGSVLHSYGKMQVGFSVSRVFVF